MDDGLLTAAVLVGWATVAGGLILAGAWLRAGGGRAPGPDDNDPLRAAPLEERVRRRGWGTGFSLAHVGTHGVLAIATVAFLTLTAATQAGQRTARLTGTLVAAAAVAILGVLLYRRGRAAANIPEHPSAEHDSSSPSTHSRRPSSSSTASQPWPPWAFWSQHSPHREALAVVGGQ
jgi:hypothetical protein